MRPFRDSANHDRQRAACCRLRTDFVTELLLTRPSAYLKPVLVYRTSSCEAEGKTAKRSEWVGDYFCFPHEWSPTTGE
jgi:hypothetical protein